LWASVGMEPDMQGLSGGCQGACIISCVWRIGVSERTGASGRRGSGVVAEF